MILGARVGREMTARLAAFAALAALVAWAWMRLVGDPPTGRVALAVVSLCGGAAVLALIGALPHRRAVTWPLAALAGVAAFAAGLIAIGFPPDQLLPEGWDRLAHQLERGFAGLDGSVEYPFEGKNESSRLVLLAGLPLALAVAAALSFWPSGRERASRSLALTVLIAAFAFAAAVVVPGEPLLWGVLLTGCVAAWLWLPGLARRDAIPALALVLAAGAAAVAIAAALDAEDPWIDYSDWELAAARGAGFDWDHDYGPLDWPREGSTVLRVRSDEPHYWRASVLDEFDGGRWLQPVDTAGRRLEVPGQVEGGAAAVDREALNPDWVETVDVAVGFMRSGLVVSPGTLIQVDGLSGVVARPEGDVALGDELEDGDDYRALAYVPDPSPRQMRRAPRSYPPVLAPYTEIGLPVADADDSAPALPLDDVDIPLRGSAGSRERIRAERPRILASPYAGMYRLAHRLTRGEQSNYGAVIAIEDHLRSDRFSYRETIGGDARYPLADFIGRDRRGYCQQFSGAMALMLRMIGIPSRVATGFTAGARDPDVPDQYLVTDFDAHSWVEVYFSGIGWVPFEPTPSAAPASSQRGEGDFPAGPAPAGDPTRARERVDGGGIPASAPPSAGGGGGGMIALGLLGLLGACAAVPVTVRARRFRSLSPAAAAAAQLRELGDGLGRFGLAIGPGETLLALEQRLRRRRPVTAAYAAKLRRGRFAPEATAPPTLAERRRVRRELRSRSGAGGRLRAILAFPLGGPRPGSLHRPLEQR